MDNLLAAMMTLYHLSNRILLEERKTISVVIFFLFLLIDTPQERDSCSSNHNLGYIVQQEQ